MNEEMEIINFDDLSVDEFIKRKVQEQAELNAKEQIKNDTPHSVEISINAKGQFSGKVKCYGATPDDAYEVTLGLSQKLEELIKQKNK